MCMHGEALITITIKATATPFSHMCPIVSSLLQAHGAIQASFFRLPRNLQIMTYTGTPTPVDSTLLVKLGQSAPLGAFAEPVSLTAAKLTNISVILLTLMSIVCISPITYFKRSCRSDSSSLH